MTENAPRPALAVVVFGCAVSTNGEPSPALARRLQRAVQEHRRQPHALVVVSGGAVRTHLAEGAVMRAWLQRHGVPAANIVVEDQAQNTLENAQRVAPLLKELGLRRVLLVTERFHMRRSQLLLLGALRGVGLGDLKVDRASAPDNLRGVARFGRWLREVFATQRDLTRLKLRQRPQA